MLDKVNVAAIVRDHLATLRNHPSRAYRFSDFLLFFVLPLALGLGIVWINGPLPSNLIGVVVTSLSIFTGLLLNLLLLAYNVARNSTPPSGERIVELRESLFQEIFSNIAFAVLVALVSVVCTLAIGIMEGCNLAKGALSFVVYYFGTMFLLTMLMLLKRVYMLLTNERVTPIVRESGESHIAQQRR